MRSPDTLPQQDRPRSGFRFSPLALLLAIVSACLSLPVSAAENTATLLPPAANGVFQATGHPAAIDDARRANFRQEAASSEARNLAHWVVNSADNRGLPFVIIDKVQAKVFVFDPQGQLRGASSALMGLAVGDDSVPGIGLRKLSSIRPEERTTPAGRFEASLDRDLQGHEVLWVDYDSAVSLHRVVKGHPKERRAERLASPSPLDKRITYGCINVPVGFFDDVVSPAFKGRGGIVYVLPETRSAREVFGSYAIEDRGGLEAAAPVNKRAVSY